MSFPVVESRLAKRRNGLLQVEDYFDEVLSWGNEVSYPGRE